MLVKLTDAEGRTRPGYSNETQWGPGVRHEVAGDGELCSAGWIHGYDDLDGEYAGLLADFMNPRHGNYHTQTMRFWRCRAGGAAQHDG